jgi:hypothetical protein
MKQQILKYSLLALVLLAGLFSWYSVSSAPNFSGTTAWVFPIACFSLYTILLFLLAILVRQEMFFELAVIFSLALSLIFAFSIWHFAILVLCVLLVISALRKIRKDLDLNIKIDLWKSLHTGKVRLVIALALLISSQYFFMVNEAGAQKFIPKLDLASVSSKLVGPILTMMNPNYKIVENRDLTVDQFILKSQQGSVDDIFSGMDFSGEVDQQIPANLPADQRDKLKQEALKQILDSQTALSQKNQQLILEEGRSQLSQMAGYELLGNEKIADVFAGLIDKKINDYFQPTLGGNEQSSLFSYIITAILFLTVWPLGVLLCFFWFILVIIIFKIFVRLKLVEIKLVMVEREMIA